MPCKQADGLSRPPAFLLRSDIKEVVSLSTNQNELFQQRMEQAQSLMAHGSLNQGCHLLMDLYNEGFEQERIYAWLFEQSAQPNEKALDAIYTANRERLAELYPNLYLPHRPFLFYQVFPLDGEYAIFNTTNQKFIYQDPDPVAMFHLFLQAGDVEGKLEEEEEQLLRETAKLYFDFSQELFLSLDKASCNISEPVPQILSGIQLFQEYNPNDERSSLLLAKYYIQLLEFDTAESWLKLYLETNVHNVVALSMLSLIYKQQGRKIEEAQLLTRILLLKEKLWSKEQIAVLDAYETRIHELEPDLPESLADMFPYMGTFLLFPAKRRDMLDSKKGYSCALGEYVFPYEMDISDWNPFIGLAPSSYPELVLDQWAFIQQAQDEYFDTKYNGWSQIKMEIRPSKTFKKWSVPKSDIPIIYSLLTTNSDQKLRIKKDGKEYETSFSPYLFRDMRVDSAMEVESDQPFLVGKPAVLAHSPKRKKLCLNIFLDAGSYRYIQEQNFSCCPNIKKFFDGGCIFANNFSAGEYTWTCYPSLMTGVGTHRHQFFLDRDYTRMSPNLSTLTDRFSQEGYYCSGVVSSISGVSTQILRNFDKLTYRSGYNYTCQDILADLLDQLEAFEDSDQFIWVYSLELHKIFNEKLCPLNMQVKDSFEEVYGEGVEENTSSVHQKFSARKTHHYWERWKQADTYFGILFDYIQSHYQPDEYIVSLFSDHGVTAIDNEEFILKPNHTQSCFMLRGAGVPARGIVKDEVTSAMDLYPSICHLAGLPVDESKIDGRLPKALGGQGREYAFTESLFPGQTYKLCVRDLDYELRFITKTVTLYDGHINLDDYTATLLDRKTMEPVDLPEVYDRFMRQVWKHTLPLKNLIPINQEMLGTQVSGEEASHLKSL